MGSERVGRFEREVFEGDVELSVWATPKFKATTVRVTFFEALDRHVAARALLTSQLRRGCVAFPNMVSLTRELERLYGAGLGLDVAKLGERHLTHARLRIVNDRYIGGDGRAFRDGLDLLSGVLLQPVEEDGGFPVASFDQERTNLVRAIRGLVDDKFSWAHQRFLEQMFDGESYARFEWGTESDALALERHEVLALHRQRLATAPLRIHAVGDLTDEDRDGLRAFAGTLASGRQPIDPPTESPHPARPPHTAVERLPIAQSKLHVGYRLERSPTELDDRDYYALGLMNAVLGGGSGLAKLFKEVREKRSLAYYVHSSLDRLKGVLILSAGVLASKWEEAATVMREQVDAMAAGRFTDEELEVARTTILNSLDSVHDSASQTIDFVLAAGITGRSADVEQVRASVAALSRDDVTRVAALPREETTYCLVGTED